MIPFSAAGAPVKLNSTLTFGGKVESAFRFSADGNRVLYVADQDTDQVLELYSVASGGGAPIKLNGSLVNGGDVVPESPRFSPNGSRVLYVADQNADEALELFSVPSTGGASVKLSGSLPVNGGVDGGSPSFSPDSSRAIYRADQDTDQVFELYSVPTAGGSSTKINGPLVNGGDVDGGGLQFSPDSTRVLYVADQVTDEAFELYSAPSTGGATLKLSGPMVSGGGVAPGSAQFSPSGSRVLYVADQNMNEVFELFSVSSSGGTPVTLNGSLVTSGDVSPTSSRFSPDSSRVVYRADQEHADVFELYSVSSTGGVPVKLNGSLVSAGDVVEDSARVSPDSSHVLYIADQDTNEKFELFNVPITGGTAIKLNGLLPSQGDVTRAEFTPDGGRVIYLANEDSVSAFELFSVPSAGGAPTKISGPLVAGGDVTDFQISPNGQRVVYRADADTNDVFELYTVSLSATTFIPGDYNHNGIVDAADYTVWRDSFGRTGAGLAADGDGSGKIDSADYNLWKTNFGRIAGSGTGAAGFATSTVPEPASLVLISLAALAFVVNFRGDKMSLRRA